jgi:poly(3-hydroxybutyrate) depolymerase
MLMLHGCGQDADSVAASARMNQVARRERCLVRYPEQNRLANAQGCWNWCDTDSGRADAEVALIMYSGIPPGTAHSAMSARGAMRSRHAGG